MNKYDLSAKVNNIRRSSRKDLILIKERPLDSNVNSVNWSESNQGEIFPSMSDLFVQLPILRVGAL